MHKGNFYRAIRDVKDLNKWNYYYVDGWIETYEFEQSESGYVNIAFTKDETDSLWYAIDTETGFALCAGNSRKDCVKKLEAKVLQRFASIYNDEVIEKLRADLHEHKKTSAL